MTPDENVNEIQPADPQPASPVPIGDTVVLGAVPAGTVVTGEMLNEMAHAVLDDHQSAPAPARPAVGDAVMFFPSNAKADGTPGVPAVIETVWGPGCVNVRTVEDGLHFSSVLLCRPGDALNPSGYFCLYVDEAIPNLLGAVAEGTPTSQGHTPIEGVTSLGIPNWTPVYNLSQARGLPEVEADAPVAVPMSAGYETEVLAFRDHDDRVMRVVLSGGRMAKQVMPPQGE